MNFRDFVIWVGLGIAAYHASEPEVDALSETPGTVHEDARQFRLDDPVEAEAIRLESFSFATAAISGASVAGAAAVAEPTFAVPAHWTSTAREIHLALRRDLETSARVAMADATAKRLAFVPGRLNGMRTYRTANA